MKSFKLFSSLAVTLITILFFNGNIILPGVDSPPFGKVLDPMSGVWNNAEHMEDYSDFTITSPAISEEVKIVYDERMVPHIYAANLHDALFAQGYVEAQNRTFQLDFIKRLAAGELSEVLGKRTVNLDKQQRRKALAYGAEKALEGWQKFTNEIELASAYVEGINAYTSTLTESSKPVEHKLIDMPIRQWSLQDCSLVQKWMSDVLCGWSRDIQNSNLKNALGKEIFDFLYPDVAKNVDPVIPEEVDYHFDTLYIQESNTLDDLSFSPIYKDELMPESPKGLGSNNWAVGAEKSVYGAPIFSNDPHLNLTLPSVWFEVGIHTPEINAYGVTIPGMPGLMMGFNDHIAWGETNVGQDVKDFFKIKWIDKSNRTYEVDGNSMVAEERIETIHIKGGDIMYDTVLYTVWGPVTYESEDGQSDYAMRWLALDPPGTAEFMTFIDAMSADNYDEYLDATDPFITPAQNFAFASKDGDIALRVNGIFPAKAEEDGKFVEDGSVSANNWQAFIPKSQNPQVLNPERGFIASANQRSADNGYPYYYNGRFEYSRNRSINDFLREDRQFSVEDMQYFQLNNRSKQAMDILPLFVKSLESRIMSNEESSVLEMLKSWNYEYNKDSEVATLYNEFWRRFRGKILDEIEMYRDSFQIAFPEDWRLVEIMEEYPDHTIFDILKTENVETSADLIDSSFMEVVSFYQDAKFDGRDISWGNYSPLNIYHLSRIPAFSSLDMNVGGHPDALNAIGTTHGPSWRMVVALKEQIEAYGVFPGGQSGNPLSKYYLTSINHWASGKYHRLQNPNNPDHIDEKLFTITIAKQ